MLTGRHSTLTAQIARRTLLLSLIAFVAIVVAAVSILIVANRTAHNRVNDVSADATREIDLFLTSIESDLQAVADSLANAEVVDDGLRSVLRRHDEVFEAGYIDVWGNVLGQRQRGSVMGEQFVIERPWLETIQNGETYIGTVSFEEFGVPFVDVAVPARTAGGELTGALVARLDLTALWQRVIALDVGEEGYTYIVDDQGQLLVYSDLELVRDGVNTETEFGLLPSELDDASILNVELLSTGTYSGLIGEDVVGVAHQLTAVPWYVVVEQPLSEAFAGYIPLFAAMVLVLVVSIFIVVTIARFLSRSVATPLQNIVQGAQNFARGNLDYRIAETQGAQELHDLSVTLNQMAGDLEQVNRTLETRIKARTRDMQLAVDVSEQISTLLELDRLLPQVVSLTAEYFDLYYAHIYLMDEETGQLVMAAGLGQAGRVMRERGHSIPLDATLSLVARAARERAPIIVSDTSAEPDFLANPLLPDTRSEAAIPLLVGQRVVGVLDVQSERAGRFDGDLITVLLTLAGQTAVAIQNARLFSEVERNSRREQAVSAVTQAIQQATNMDEVLKIAVRGLGQALHSPHTTIELQLASTEDPVVEGSEEPAPQPTTTT